MNRPRLPLAVIAILVPLVVTLVGILVIVPFVPARDIAVHWGPSGEPDGYAPAWVTVLVLAIVGVLTPLAFGIPLFATRRDGVSFTQKTLAVVSLWLAVFLVLLGGWMIFGQQDAGAAPPPVGLGPLLAFGVSLPVAVLAWAFAPPIVPVEPVGTPAEPLPIADGERAVWLGRTRLATPGLIVVVLAILLSAAAGVFAAIVTDGAAAAVLGVPVLVLALLLTTSYWTVRADATGLTVRSATGWPRFHVAADEIAQAGTTRATALGEFGGWGIRFGRGRRLGIIMRSGEALEVQNRDGGALVVTVDDAGTAARLLSAVAHRATERG
ncbi:MAG: DUF1648 domain-containing protein [Pseudolysinimonas sp.]|uniref:DUF1648 domain-containing protein n=1 Tax=Pseudolysinimonas sp. TaxID=2680009 RepID=UPI003C721BCA